jgi:dihydroneopterin aldolase
MNDRVFIRGLELYCTIGVRHWEREVQQKVSVDLDLEADCRAAGASDDVAQALDYRAVAKFVQKLIEASSFQLVEALAERIAAAVLAEFPRASRVRVRLAKPGAVRWSHEVGVEIERDREGAVS